MNQHSDLADLLNQHMIAAKVGDARLANQVNARFHRSHFLHRSTIRNWRNGTAKKVKDWRQLAAIAAVLTLDEIQANQLLKAANLPTISELYLQADEADSLFLSRWLTEPPKKTPLSRPLQLPPRAHYFTGRQTELAQLLDKLQPGCLTTLCGPGGIGKTTLASEAIYQLMDDDELVSRFPDGVIWHDFYSQPQVALALEKIVLSFGEEPRPNPTIAAQRLLAERQLLLLLDGAEAADDLPTLLKLRGQCGVLITSRLRQDAPVEWQDITPMTIEESIILLQAWGGVRASNHKICRQVCQLLGGLPLAVQLVGRYINHQEEDAADYLIWLQQTPLVALDLGQQQRQSIPLLLAQSIEQLSDTAQQALAVIGLIALAPFARQEVAYALEMSPVQVGRPLGELVNYGLLRRQQKHYLVSHALIHTYAHHHLSASKPMIKRLVAYYSTIAREQDQRGPEGYPQLNAIRPHVITLLTLLKQQKQWTAIDNLVWSIEPFLGIQGHWIDRITAIEIGLAATRQQGDFFRIGAALVNLGLAYAGLGRLTQAVEYYQEALAMSRQHKHSRIEEAALGNLGNAYRHWGQMRQAIIFYQEALAISREIGNQYGEGLALGNLGHAHHRLGQIEQAIAFTQQALVTSRQMDDRRREGTWLANLGHAFFDLKQIEQAMALTQQALAISREIGDHHNEGSCLGNLGRIHRAMGQSKKGIDYFQKALTLSLKSSDRSLEGCWRGHLGQVYGDLGQTERSIAFTQEALAISCEIGDRYQEGRWLGYLGQTYIAQNQLTKGIALLQQALFISQEVEDSYGEAEHLNNLNRALEQVEQEQHKGENDV